MTILTVWLAIMAAGGLCFPRRPRAAGVLFIAAGGFLLAVWIAGAIARMPLIPATTSAAVGLGMLWRFRERTARASHAAEWTGKARGHAPGREA